MIKRKQIENKIWVYLHETIDEKYSRSFLTSIRELLTWEVDNDLTCNINEALSE
jgi:uncharacterized UBP type Zn finger protein